MTEKTIFLFLDGLKEISKILKGTENIWLGIRPFGFHAANKIPFVAYPIMLCEELKKNGIEPKFNFYVFLNDYEQFKLMYVNKEESIFNVYPEYSTIQYTQSKEDPNKTAIDFWQPIIEFEVLIIKKLFPNVKISFIRNSSMKTFPVFKKVLLESLEHPEIIKNTIEECKGVKIPGNPKYAMAICPKCKKAVQNTKLLVTGEISIECDNCGTSIIDKYENFDYWLYHKQLSVPRLQYYQIDLCISGSDHYIEGDNLIRPALIKAFGLDKITKNFKTLYTPYIKASNGEKMSKSKNNVEYIRLNNLMELLQTKEQEITLPKEKVIDKETYLNEIFKLMKE